MWARSCALAAVLVLSVGCSVKANYADAIRASTVFHLLMDRGEYAAIYDTAARGFQQSISRDVLMRFLSRVSRKVGKCQGANVGFGGYVANTSGTYVTTTASRTCANGPLSEQFVWLMVGGKAILLQYNANSPLLLTD